MTRALGCQYIWIKALTIVQDDEANCAIEASRMADIYAAAWLVLAASNASDCADDFLHPGEARLAPTSEHSLRQEIFLIERRTEDHVRSASYGLEKQPLMKRAWAMQKRELACRIVHFLPNEILWRCQEIIFWECVFKPVHSIDISPFSGLSNIVSGQARTEEAFAFGIAWTTVIDAYQHLHMTRLSDTLPALTGKARYVEKCNPVNTSLGCGRNIYHINLVGEHLLERQSVRGFMVLASPKSHLILIRTGILPSDSSIINLDAS